MNSSSLSRHPPLKTSTNLQAPWSKAYSEISTSTPNTTVEVSKHLNAFEYKGCRGVEKKSAIQLQKMPAGVAAARTQLYCLAVAANSATGLGNPLNVRRNSAPFTIAGAFFVPADPFYGGCAWETFGSAGLLTSRFTNLRTAATPSLGNERGSSSTLGVSPMTALIPSKIRILAHRRMALSALRANSSLSVRLTRYNAHMAIARSLETGGVQ